MDDSKGAVIQGRSLRWMLSMSICGTILVVGIIGALASFWFAFDEARDLQDDELREIAHLVRLDDRSVMSSEPQHIAQDEPEMRIWVIRTFKTGTTVTTPDLSLSLPANLPEGLHTVTSRGESWRLYAKTVNNQHGLVVAQRTSTRNEIARDSAIRTLIPFLVVIPILVLLTAILIRILLRKVKEVADQLDRKGDDDFEALGVADVPAEFIPFVTATNRLLERVQRILSTHRQFVASAAHELRSPVTAMTLHLDNALGADGEVGELATKLAPISAGLERMRVLVEQLLSLARIQSKTVYAGEVFFAKDLVVEAMGDVFPVADTKGVDLGLVVGESMTLYGNKNDFRALVRNAIENAVLYTPPHGKVDVRFYRKDAEAMLEVDDSGPGIAQAHLARVFDPFYRIPGSGQAGSGLGLSIIRSAAARLGGTVTLTNHPAGAGTGLTLVYRQPLRHDEPARRPQAEVN